MARALSRDVRLLVMDEPSAIVMQAQGVFKDNVDGYMAIGF